MHALYAPLHLRGVKMRGVTLGKSLLCSASADTLAELRGLLLYYFIKHLAEP